MDTQQSAAKVLAHKVRPFLGWWKKSLGNVALTQARTIVGSLPFVISTFVAGVASGDVIDFEGLGLLEGDPVPIINGVTVSGDIAIQGSPAFGFGVNFGGDDAGNTPPFSNAGNVFITNPGGFASPETVKIITFEFATPVTNLSFLVADIDFCPVNDLRERLVADVFDQDGNLLTCVIFEAPLGGNGGDGDVVLIDFGAVTGIVALEIRVDFSVGNGSGIGHGIDNLSFTTADQGITIDATALSSQLMNIFAIGNFNSNTITTFELDPGTYSISGADHSFAFLVTGSGVLEYDAALDGFVSGRGTNTLTILGYDINFDATALSSQLMVIFAIGNFNSGTLTTFTLLPGIYSISGADRNFVFQLTDSGVLDFDTALEGFVAGFGSDTLTILGYDVTFDLTALSPQLVNIFSVGNFNTDTPTTFTLIPGPYTPSVAGDTFGFTLANDGMISGLPSTFQELPLSVSGTRLIISGLIESVPAPSGLISWWDADSVSGTIASDIQDGNDGTLKNGATTVPGFVGQAFSLDGSDDFVEVANEAAFDITGKLTVDAWVQVTTFLSQVVVAKGTGASIDRGWELRVGPNFEPDVISFCVLQDNGVFICKDQSIVGLLGTFMHVAGVFDKDLAGDARVKLYLNGVEGGTYTSLGAFSDIGLNNFPVTIGARADPTNRKFLDGLIDEVEIFDRALDASEIQAIFLAGSAGKCKDVDSDGDGLLDSTELEIAMESGCPDPGNPDSDGDTLSDGFEVLTLGTNPCNSDTDGDGIDDSIDPLPTQPGVTSGFLEDASRDLGTVVIPQLDLNVFNGPNNNANQGRRGALANRANEAANLIATGDIQGAIDKLTSLLEKIDGQSPPPDWMDDSPEKDALAADVDLLILLLLLL